ncbi:MAG: M20 family metallopeptidase [Bdellovibrionales bacterium]|nr:M20 family metallopeptidase [Bdellovibrionales bacterium]
MGLEIDVRQWFDAQRGDALGFLGRMVDINSHTSHPDGVDEVQELLEGEFRALGMTTKFIEHDGYGRHLIATTPAVDRSSRSNIMLVGHADTVFEFDSDPRPFRIDGDWAYGDGVADDKGGVLCILWALRVLKEAGLLHRLPVVVYISSMEEDPAPIPERVTESFRQVVSSALVFEPGRKGDCVITRRRGLGRFEVIVEGRRAHAGNDHKDGASAIRELARLVLAFEALTDYAANVTVNIGTIQGGTAPNVVPGRARASFEVRVPDAEAFRAVRERMFALSSKPSVKGTRVQLRLIRAVAPLEETEESRALYASYHEHAQNSGLQYDVCPLVGGGSDANFLASLGIPCIDGLGPYGENFHATNERLLIPSIGPKVANLAYWLAAQLA